MCIRLNNARMWGCDWLTEDADFGKKKIIFSDEAQFDLGEYVTKQNCRTHTLKSQLTHKKRVTVWCRYWSRGIIGQFFFENRQAEAVKVNGNRYRNMLNEFLFIKMKRKILATFGFNRTSLRATRIFVYKNEEKNISNIWFQQDGATSYTAEATLDVLRPIFEDRIISRREKKRNLRK